MPETYVLRIYRRNGSGSKDGRMLVGVLEKADEGAAGRVFYSIDDLVGMLKLEKHWSSATAPVEENTANGKPLRFKLNLPVKVQSLSDAAGTKFTEETTLSDIGSGGTYLLLDSAVEVGQRVRLLIDPGKSDLEMNGTVVRVTGVAGEKKGVGISFDVNC